MNKKIGRPIIMFGHVWWVCDFKGSEQYVSRLREDIGLTKKQLESKYDPLEFMCMTIEKINPISYLMTVDKKEGIFI